MKFSNVIYNTATLSFEALVTFHNDNCMWQNTFIVKAPNTTPFEKANTKLSNEVKRRHKGNKAGSLSSKSNDIYQQTKYIIAKVCGLIVKPFESEQLLNRKI